MIYKIVSSPVDQQTDVSETEKIDSKYLELNLRKYGLDAFQVEQIIDFLKDPHISSNLTHGEKITRLREQILEVVPQEYQVRPKLLSDMPKHDKRFSAPHFSERKPREKRRSGEILHSFDIEERNPLKESTWVSSLSELAIQVMELNETIMEEDRYYRPGADSTPAIAVESDCSSISSASETVQDLNPQLESPIRTSKMDIAKLTELAKSFQVPKRKKCKSIINRAATPFPGSDQMKTRQIVSHVHTRDTTYQSGTDVDSGDDVANIYYSPPKNPVLYASTSPSCSDVDKIDVGLVSYASTSPSTSSYHRDMEPRRVRPVDQLGKENQGTREIKPKPKTTPYVEQEFVNEPAYKPPNKKRLSLQKCFSCGCGSDNTHVQENHDDRRAAHIMKDPGAPTLNARLASLSNVGKEGDQQGDDTSDTESRSETEMSDSRVPRTISNKWDT
ncbi:MAG: hypothetical protein HRT90_11850 [Candidatus Margulisbacteria bacterium]|nr:hypothetical protein [Candidatus Margulisiibacteriota bacterium]